MPELEKLSCCQILQLIGEAIGRKKTFDLLTRTASKIEARSAGLPLAVQIAARPWNEQKVIAIIDKLHKDIEVKDLQRLYLAGSK